ncbi:aldolase [Orrella sp. JC864]|uniref:aldolase n=1 Tax=Orrella sp. JC864 TaxID=3120298 RepID=UPI0012BD6219
MTTTLTAPALQDPAAFYRTGAVARLREDLALALRAAAHHGLSESVCNHFSVAADEGFDTFLLNPRGLMWEEVQADDIVLVDAQGEVLHGRHEVEPTAMFIHAAVHRIARKVAVLHTHMPHATALTLTTRRGLDTGLSQNAMRFAGRTIVDPDYNGLALDAQEGERIARAMGDADVAFLANHGVVVCGARIDYAYDDLYFLERACQAEVLARATGLPLEPVQDAMARKVAAQVEQERLQSTLFFEALRRRLPSAC